MISTAGIIEILESFPYTEVNFIYTDIHRDE